MLLETRTSHLTDEEFLSGIENISKENIIIRFKSIFDRLVNAEKESKTCEKYYESSMEQSSFRRNLLECIQSLCEEGKKDFRYKETKELCKDILLMIKNSYVEL